MRIKPTFIAGRVAGLALIVLTIAGLILEPSKAKDAAPVTAQTLEAEFLPQVKGSPEQRADAFHRLGKALFGIREYALSEKYLLQALQFDPDIKRPREYIGTKAALAIVYTHDHKIKEAKQQYEELLSVAEKLYAQTRSADDRIEYSDAIVTCIDSMGTICLNYSNDWEEAGKWFRRAFELAKERNNLTAQINALVNQATSARKRMDRDGAMSILMEAVALTSKMEPERSSGEALLNLGRLEHDLGQISESNKAYEKALEIFKSLMIENVEEATAHLNMAENNYEIHNVAAACTSYKQGLERLKEEPSRSALDVQLLSGLGTAETDLGNFAVAIKHHEEAIALAKKLGLQELQLEAILHLGNDELLKGDPQKALLTLLEGEKLVAASNLSSRSRGGFSMAIGRCYKSLGEPEAALRYYLEALKFFKDLDQKSDQAQILSTMAVLHFDGNRPDLAQDCFREARKIYELIDDKRNVAALDYNEAQLLVIQGKRSDAMKLYSSSIDSLKAQGGDNIYEPMILRGMGLCEFLDGHPQKALTYYQESLKYPDQSIESQWDSNLGLGKCYKRLGLTELAVTHLSKSTELVEQERRQLTRDSFKTYNLDFRTNCFQELLDLYVQLNKPYEAIEIAEKGRARAFLDMLSSRKSGKVAIETVASPVSLAPAAPTNQPALIAKAEPGSRSVSVVPRTTNQVFSSTAMSPENAAPPDISEIKTLVEQSKSTVLEYYILPDKIIAWVIDPDAKIHMAPPIPLNEEKLGTKIRETYKMVTSAPKDKTELEAFGKKREEMLKDLYMSIFAPVENFLPKDPAAVITIVPHGPMFSIPFAALLTPDGSYLVEKHTLAYSPAIGVWRATQKLEAAASKEPNKLLAFGNPITDAIAFLGKLPYSEKEVQNIASLFGKENSLVKIGQDANKKAFADLAPGYTDVHLATHGLLDEEKPMNSSLVLAPTNDDDGMLSVKDIMCMSDLKAKLVVLSACQTGRGKITGDGVVGLSRAFIIAGTPAVMVSQWNVDDIMTEYQMKQFYKSYLAGAGKSKSLREAQLATIKFMEGSTRPALRANPRYWAAFQLIGQAI